ncbi:MAG: hypothetical protein R2874_00970 [Desulfobacterales bacterium]
MEIRSVSGVIYQFSALAAKCPHIKSGHTENLFKCGPVYLFMVALKHFARAPQKGPLGIEIRLPVAFGNGAVDDGTVFFDGFVKRLAFCPPCPW